MTVTAFTGSMSIGGYANASDVDVYIMNGLRDHDAPMGQTKRFSLRIANNGAVTLFSERWVGLAYTDRFTKGMREAMDEAHGGGPHLLYIKKRHR